MHSRRLTCAIMLFLPALVVAADWPTDGPVWIAGVFGEYHQGDEFAPGEYLATYHSGIDIPAANPSDPHATHIRAVSQERFHAAYSEFTLPGSNTVVNKVGPYIHQTVRRFQGWSNGQPAPIIYLPLDIGQYATFYMLDVWEVYNVTTGQALPILELWEDTSYHDYNGNPVPGCFRREVVLACPTPAATDEIRVGGA